MRFNQTLEHFTKRTLTVRLKAVWEVEWPHLKAIPRFLHPTSGCQLIYIIIGMCELIIYGCLQFSSVFYSFKATKIGHASWSVYNNFLCCSLLKLCKLLDVYGDPQSSKHKTMFSVQLIKKHVNNLITMGKILSLYTNLFSVLRICRHANDLKKKGHKSQCVYNTTQCFTYL